MMISGGEVPLGGKDRSTQSLRFLLGHVLGKDIFLLPIGQAEICLLGVGVFAHLLTQIEACFPPISKGEIV